MKTNPRIEVSAAVILQEHRVFATQRGYGEWKDGWEFPGGKREPGETPEACLRREILEELDTEIAVGEELICVEYDYPTFHLTLHCFRCEILHGSLSLREHEAACWLTADELEHVDWLPVDRAVLPILQELLSHS